MGLILGPCRLGLDLSCSPWRDGGLPWTLGGLSLSRYGTPWSLERLTLWPWRLILMLTLKSLHAQPGFMEAHPGLVEVYLGAMELHPVALEAHPGALEAHSWSMEILEISRN
jgi:hypothetical protein